MLKWLSILFITTLFSCSSKNIEDKVDKKFIAPKGISVFKNNDYSKLTELEINWTGNLKLEAKLNLSNSNCGLRIGAFANRDSTSTTYVFEGNQPLDSISFITADSCLLFFKSDFDLSCSLKQEAILFYQP